MVGSTARNEYVEGISDINLYVLVDDKIDEKVLDQLNLDAKFNIKLLTKETFLSQRARKDRFICHADGILILGNDLIGEERFPRPSLELALLLNGDFQNELNEWERWIREHPSASPIEISKKARSIAKRMLDFLYGVAIANKPSFSSSRNERVETIKRVFPGEKNIQVLGVLDGIISGRVGRLKDLDNMIEGFKPQALENLAKMKAAQAQFDEERKRAERK